MVRRFVVLMLGIVSVLVALGMPESAYASQPAPGWEIFTRVAPTNLPPTGKGEIYLYVYNTGAGEGEAPTIVDTLPAGVSATGATLYLNPDLGQVGAQGEVGPCQVASGVVTCTAEAVPPGAMLEVAIAVNVAGVVPGTEAVNRASAVGGGAVSPASQSKVVKFSASLPGFGFAGVDTWATNADGTPDTQAGSHPYELTVTYAMNSRAENGFGSFREYTIGGETRDLVVNLPPGIVGDPTAVPRCTRRQFDGETSFAEEPGCAPSTQVGIDVSRVQGFPISFRVFNMVPPPGVAAQFAFNYEGTAVFLDAGVRTGGPTPGSQDYGISEHVDNVPQREIVFNSTTIWGVPGEENHDAQRKGNPSGAGLTPFLTLPTSCEGPQEVSFEAQNTWESEDTNANASFVTHDNTGAPLGFTGCDHLGFAPAISVAPDTGHADTPAGLSVNVEVPQAAAGDAAAEGLSTSNIKDTTVTLPEGVVINPGQAAGLVACPESEDGRDGEGPPSCPLASKVGTVEIETPLLFDKLQGNVYILPSNPPHLQLLVAASGDGVNLKLIGDVHLNGATGQLVTTFSGTPELPFTDFKLAFSGGAQAALETPTMCGTYTTTSDFTPWSTPLVQDAFPSSSFAVESGPGGSACQNPLPFHPELIAGATTDQAGGYTGFSMLLQRGDGQQRFKSLQFKTPEGLLGMISKVPLCGEPQAAQGTCPQASEIGHTVVTAGPGPYPLVVPEPGQPPAPIYLTGGYEGAPYGLSIVVPIDAGPFNLGTEVVRGRIEVDPHTAQLTITTDPLPTVVKGIPADLRVVNAVIDRPGFMFNPTSCAPMSFSGSATSTEGVVAPISSHFQVGSCQALKFQPNFKVSTSAKTSRTNGASLDARIVYPVGNLGFNQASSQSNIRLVKVELPKQLPSRLKTLQKACPVAVFEANPGGCPAASVIGHASAVTPVLPVPLTGPAYFVSHGGEQFPSLVVVLQGYGVTVDLVGTTFISKAGITSSTFKQVPDVPIASFELVLPEGQFSALTANGDLCKGALVMPTEFIGQNEAFLKQSTKITVSGCPKAKQATHKKKRKARHKKTKGKGRKKRGRKG
jgi:hypothetical protein